MEKIIIKLNNEDVTDNVTVPMGLQNTLDESLDQYSIKLSYTDINEPIRPFTSLDIEFWENNGLIRIYNFFVQNDQMTEVLSNGTYTHELSLIELTKWTERFTNIIKCNTKPLAHDFNGMQNPVLVTETHTRVVEIYQSIWSGVASPIIGEQYFTLMSRNDFITSYSGGKYTVSRKGGIYVTENGREIINYTGDDSISFKAKVGKKYKVTYTGYYGSTTDGIKCSYYLDCVSAKHLESNKTIPQVINELLDTAETIRINDAPRFALDPVIESKYAETIAPEINLSGSLFECLSQIGDFIHCIPRLRKSTSFDGEIVNPTQYVLTFDELGSEKKTDKDLSQYIGHTESFDIGQYATSLDSVVNNMVNTDRVSEGSITEPSDFTLKTLRTDIATVVLTTENCFIETEEAVEQIIKVECGYVGDNVWVGDITPFVYSKTEYDGMLSSITDNYPLSKGFAIYYNQGSKNIYGLNFKLPNAINPSFSNYAIINIINKKTGGDYKSEDIRNLQFRVTYIPNSDGRVKQTKTNIKDLGFASSINFNQTAQKISSTQFGEAMKGALAKLGNPEITKSYIFASIKDLPAVGDLFDENYYIAVVKGEIYNDFIKCDIGLSKNYNRKDRYMQLNSQIRFYEVSEQQAINRQIYYEDYCIIGDDVDIANKVTYLDRVSNLTTFAVGSAMFQMPTKQRGKYTFELKQGNKRTRIAFTENDLPYSYTPYGITFTNYDFIDNTIGLTLTQEVSIGLFSVETAVEKPLITDTGLVKFEESFGQDAEPFVIDSVIAKGYDKFNNELGEYIKPVTAVGVGNAILFHYEYPDNYTVGTSRATENDSVLQYQESYVDFNGEIEELQIRLGKKATREVSKTKADAIAYGNNLPNTDGRISECFFAAHSDGTALCIHKDNREILGVNYQINFVTNSDLIIGSELAKSSTFICKDKMNYKLYLLKNKIPKFTKELVLTNAIDMGYVTITNKLATTGKMQLKIENISAETIGNNTGVAWAICNGNKLLFGSNNRVAPNVELSLPFITFKHIIL